MGLIIHLLKHTIWKHNGSPVPACCVSDIKVRSTIYMINDHNSPEQQNKIWTQFLWHVRSFTPVFPWNTVLAGEPWPWQNQPEIVWWPTDFLMIGCVFVNICCAVLLLSLFFFGLQAPEWKLQLKFSFLFQLSEIFIPCSCHIVSFETCSLFLLLLLSLLPLLLLFTATNKAEMHKIKDEI